jgi:ABC-2 type transport system ATP-binding protein
MILTLQNISKSYGLKNIFSGLSFSMGRGQLYGIVGENGSGKSTLLRIIVGELAPTSGKVFINGRLGYCPQKTVLISQLSVWEHFKYFAAAYSLKESAWKGRCEELMEYFNFKEYQNEYVRTLSGGTQQKVNLCIALLHQPDILILDEPYNGFDWETYTRFWSYTEQLREQGCGVLVVTHLLADQTQFDHVYNLKKGELL